MHKYKLAISFLFTLFLTCKAVARAPDFTIHQEYTSTRALGMGNAFIAVADDHSGLFYNPASLAVRKDTHLRMFLRAGLDADVLDFADDIDGAEDDPAAINATLEKYYGDHLYFRAPTLGGVLVRPKWGLAVIPADFSVDMALHRSLAASVAVNAYLDSTIAFGRGYNWKVKALKNKLSFGWTAKLLHRVFYSDVLQSAQLTQSETDLVNLDRAAEGVTLDADLGFLYEVGGKRKWFKPTYAFVVRNVFDYGFPENFAVFNDDPVEPPKLERRFDFGTKFDLPDFWVFDPKMAIDMKDVGHRNWTWLKGLHVGAEMYWKVANWWKGHWSVGLNQGYLTAGFGARLGIFQLDLATWGEEVGTSDARTESRRYIVETSLDF